MMRLFDLRIMLSAAQLQLNSGSPVISCMDADDCEALLAIIDLVSQQRMEMEWLARELSKVDKKHRTTKELLKAARNATGI